MRLRAYNFEMASPSDVSGLAWRIERGELLAEQATEGVMTPHRVVFVCDGERKTGRAAKKRLCVGTTRSFAPEEIGRTAQVAETARVVRDDVAGMQVDARADIHLVQLTGAIPPYTHLQAERARGRGETLRSDMADSRGASVLGGAVALGEVPAALISDHAICTDYSLYSAVASCSAEPGLVRTEVLALANSASLRFRAGGASRPARRSSARHHRQTGMMRLAWP